MRIRRSALVVLVGLLATACTAPQPGSSPPTAEAAALRLDSAQLLRDIRVLAADSMEGRRTGTAGNARARAYLVDRLGEVGLAPFGVRYEHPFSFTSSNGERIDGVNLVGYLRGTHLPDRYLVVTAHYDHLGIRDGQIYNGADDNASGTAALLALAAHFLEYRTRHSLVFVATDAEEGSVLGGEGLQGARAFVADPPIAPEHILVNVNMDMISRNDRNELYAAGTYHYPQLLPLVRRVAARAPLRLLTGHDHPGLPPGDDWTLASDHGAFHAVGIPFLYFGVEDHPDYHRPTDTFEYIQPGFYVRAVSTVLDFITELDGHLQGERPVD